MKEFNSLSFFEELHNSLHITLSALRSKSCCNENFVHKIEQSKWLTKKEAAVLLNMKSISDLKQILGNRQENGIIISKSEHTYLLFKPSLERYKEQNKIC